jgi:DNA-binding MarR family transcriptional regulator
MCICTYMPTRSVDASVLAISTDCACLNVRRTARAITALYDRTLAPTGLRAGQLTLLVALERAGPVPFTRLAGVLGMDRTTLTRNLAPLRRDRLVALGPGPDRRVRLATITEKGRKVLTAAIPLWEEAQDRIAGALGPGRWQAIRRDLHRLAELAGDDMPEGGPES